MDEFEEKTLEPMLFFESEEVFDSEDHIFELKFDGARCLAYLDHNQTILINKRKKDISRTYPELSAIHKQIKEKCILDGELVAMNQGKPDFFLLQKRALATNPFKIKTMMTKIPVVLVVFDLLYYHNQVTVDLPLMERKKLLAETVMENNQLILSRYIETRGKDFFALAQKENLEGIVAKKKDSLYYPGKRSRVWLKMKVYQDEDYVICGYVPIAYGMKDVIFGAYNEHHQLYHAATVMSNKDKELIMGFAEKHPGPPLFPASQEQVIWMKPYLVGTLQFMMKTKSGGLRQAVFKGVRDDKTASDLLIQ